MRRKEALPANISGAGPARAGHVGELLVIAAYRGQA